MAYAFFLGGLTLENWCGVRYSPLGFFSLAPVIISVLSWSVYAVLNCPGLCGSREL